METPRHIQTVVPIHGNARAPLWLDYEDNMDYSVEEEGKTKGYRGFVKEEGTFKYPETNDAEREVTEKKELNTKEKTLSDIKTDTINEGPNTDQKGTDRKM